MNPTQDNKKVDLVKEISKEPNILEEVESQLHKENKTVIISEHEIANHNKLILTVINY